jgi:hypothetical protein
LVQHMWNQDGELLSFSGFYLVEINKWSSLYIFRRWISYYLMHHELHVSCITLFIVTSICASLGLEVRLLITMGNLLEWAATMAQLLNTSLPAYRCIKSSSGCGILGCCLGMYTESFYIYDAQLSI